MNQTEIYSPHFFLVSSQDTIQIKPPCILGRSKGEVQIKDSKLSSQHCEFSVSGIRFFIKDLKSTNGTFVNRNKVNPGEEIEIQLNDQIQIGTHIYTLSFEKPKIRSDDSETFLNDQVRIFSINNIINFYNASLPSRITYFIFITLSAVGVYLDHGRMTGFTLLSMLCMSSFAFAFFLCFLLMLKLS